MLITHRYKLVYLTVLVLLLQGICFAQIPNLPQAPQPTQFQRYDQNNFNGVRNTTLNYTKPVNSDYQRQQLQQQQLMNEVEQREKRRVEIYNEIQKEIREYYAKTGVSKYHLPSFSSLPATKYYYDLFAKMQQMDSVNFSTKELNFEIENAYFENKMSKEQFNQIIKQTGAFLLAKMKELDYDTNSNSAKNFMLFQYFTETLEVNGFKEKHFPIKYDFEDYRGEKDWSKMFVTKLLKTQTGQCHSMPLLYLTLAEELGAEAFLAYSPEHSYIRFQDEKSKKWFNVELTNGMFSTPSYILGSGYIKAEALQNQIYMQNQSKQDLFSQFYYDLAKGYIRKFGYDDFVEKVIYKAIDLSPKNIFAQLVLSDYNTQHFMYACDKENINPNNHEELQKIKNYPELVALLLKTNKQYKIVDDLGYEKMPDKAYKSWLNDMKQEKNKQENQKAKAQLQQLTKALNKTKPILQRKD